MILILLINLSWADDTEEFLGIPVSPTRPDAPLEHLRRRLPRVAINKSPVINRSNLSPTVTALLETEILSSDEE